MKNAILERAVIRSAHVFAEKQAEIDEQAFALLRNRDRYIALSAATDSYLNLCDDREPSLPCGYTAPAHYLEF